MKGGVASRIKPLISSIESCQAIMQCVTFKELLVFDVHIMMNIQYACDVFNER
jgi:hypothetical protein